MEQGIRAFVAVNFLVMGVSHIVQHRAWAEFFVHLHGLGRPGAFANGFLSLVLRGTYRARLPGRWAPGTGIEGLGLSLSALTG